MGPLMISWRKPLPLGEVNVVAAATVQITQTYAAKAIPRPLSCGTLCTIKTSNIDTWL